MKRFFVIAIVMLFSAFQLSAQKVGYVQLNSQKIGYIDTEKILNAIPEYKVAQDKLEALSKQYQEKIEAEYKKVEQLYNSYQSQKDRLSPQVRTQRENEIIKKEKSVKELQKTYFGEDGYMQKKSKELLDPIREKVDIAIEKLATNGNYMILIDISATQGIVYANSNDDLSDEVIKYLGK
jgi:Outer membrane protein